MGRFDWMGNRKPWDIKLDISLLHELHELLTGSVLCGALVEHFYFKKRNRLYKDIDFTVSSEDIIINIQQTGYFKIWKCPPVWPKTMYQGVFHNRQFDVFIDTRQYTLVNINGEKSIRLESPEYRLQILEHILTMRGSHHTEEWQDSWLRRKKAKARKYIKLYKELEI